MDAFKSSEAARAGLCPTCRHAKIVRSDRGSEFTYCRKSESDPGFPKYPRLPVLDCAGYAGISGTTTA